MKSLRFFPLEIFHLKEFCSEVTNIKISCLRLSKRFNIILMLSIVKKIICIWLILKR